MRPLEDDVGMDADGDVVDFRRGIFNGWVVGVQHNAAPRTPTSWPCQVGTMPPQAVCFQDRAEVARLAAALAGGGAAVVTPTAQVGVVVGLGGVGKTQLAAHYARSLWRARDLDVLVWITASSREAVINGYADAAARLLGIDRDDPVGAASVLLAWLEPKADQSPCRWLVVLDDVSDPADLAGQWPPLSPTGRVLITTRRQDAALTTGRHHIPVGLFSPTACLAYLTQAVAHDEPEEELVALAEDLGRLPLALSQAAAYLTDTGTSAADYRRLLADRTTTLRTAAPDSLPDGQRLTTAATWALSIDHADRLRPPGLARPLLQLAAFLDPNGIPDTVLASLPARTYLALHRTGSATTSPADGTQGREDVPEQEVRWALSALRRLSLIQHEPGTPHTAIRVHQLIQRAVRDTLTSEQHDQAAQACADALLTVWPDIEDDMALAQTLRANTGALAACARGALFQPDVHRVLYQAGSSLGEAAQFTSACDYFNRLTETVTGRLGPDHSDTLICRQRLAYWKGESGDTAGAVSAFTDLLNDQNRVLGEEHRDTLITRACLAYSRLAAGDTVGAQRAYADLLPRLTRILGQDHLDTVIVKHALTFVKAVLGDTADVTDTLVALIADRSRLQGVDHPETLAARHDLAYWLGESGDAASAAAAYADLLPHTVRVLGDDHPLTLNARRYLAHWQGEAGDAAAAANILTDLLPHMSRVLGESHPRTLIVRHDLAYWQGDAGDAAVAAIAHAELLPHMIQVLGEDHRLTLILRTNLARWQGETGDAARATATFTALLPRMIQALGENHRHTLIARHYLAHWQGEMGDTTAAASALTELLPHMIQVLGENNTHARTAQHNLARWHCRS